MSIIPLKQITHSNDVVYFKDTHDMVYDSDNNFVGEYYYGIRFFDRIVKKEDRVDYINYRYTINFPIDIEETKAVNKISKKLKITFQKLENDIRDYCAIYNGDKYSIVLSDGFGFINFGELDKDYICSIVNLLGEGLGFNKPNNNALLDVYNILFDNMVIDNETKEEFMLIDKEENSASLEEQIKYRYEAYFAFQNKNAYTVLNDVLGYNLKNKTDEYTCEKYRLNMNTKFLHVYFKELDKAFIKDTMNKIVRALGEEEFCWDVKDLQEDSYIDE